MNSARLVSYSLTVVSSGLIITVPSIPSRTIKSPSLTSSVIVLQATTAGISKERAMIAEWEVLPPILVANPLTKFLFNCAVSEGVKSSAIITTSSSIKAGFGNGLPSKLANKRRETSLISAALSLK